MLNRRSLMAFSAGLVSLAIVGAAGGAASAAAQSPADQTANAVRQAIQRLPDYSVFDYIAFTVDRGTVTLLGYTTEEKLRADAEAAAKQVDRVENVVNKIELLPVSQYDDRIRWATFYRIYTDDFLSRYAPGGARQVWREVQDQSRFPGMQPVGIYPIHIIVRNGRTMLLGVVDNATDRQLAEVRAREVTGVFEVENSLSVRSSR